MLIMKKTLLFIFLISSLAVSCQKEDDSSSSQITDPKPVGSKQLTLLNFESTLSSLHQSDLSDIQFSILEKGSLIEEKPDSIKIENADVHFFIPERGESYQVLAIGSKTTGTSIQLGIFIEKFNETPLVKSWNATFAGIGVGSKEDPFLVTRMEQFKTIAGNSELHYLLANNLDFASEENWVPFKSFSGVLDGGFHQLLNFRSFYHENPVVSGLIWENTGVIKNLIIKGRNTPEPDLGSVWSGAFACSNRGTILNCANYCNTGSSLYQGGIVSTNDGLIKNCANYGNALNGTTMGGIASLIDQGGIIENCHNHGNATPKDDDNIKGFSGGIIEYDYLGEGDKNLIKNCYNYGLMTPGNDIIGPIFGQVLNTTIEGCFYLKGGTDPSTEHPNVIGKTDAELKLKATYAGWAFGDNDESPWKMSKNGYPILYWETE